MNWVAPSEKDSAAGRATCCCHAYFHPYKALKPTLKAEINADAWDMLNSVVSHPFDKPKGGRIAVNHLGDEVMKVFRV